ncbi:MAG TPA: protein-L-isoaspartate(D-aspartate) O-methyltransferase [Candidatus Competibacteraceae bacterium]|nr:protein-L-isoaspartate(D-aspartate) O-methyltransferase [Candidatus Competibacteraceae bacterium]MCP5133388.1 protein-L-isoaspartate(D-aspartate) O-methyltransferase [Gammaproteobacteria bacterium]HPF57220.1 protein-L-isoaspartate(D-aspartate) O-methyltransferase [Candidatus Competibacteraceae bacterium]
MHDRQVDPDTEARQWLLERVLEETRETAELTGLDTLSSQVREAIAAVPRHRFVLPAQQEWAYIDRPLPIGCGQTISQPFIVALMTELLAPGPEDTVLEVGTGSGYQAAILARLVRQVYSLERIPELANVASQRLQALGVGNVEVRTGDGIQGWEEHAPFDGIIVTAAAGEVPPVLVQQLKPGGRLVIPVGPPNRTQDLRVLEKDPQGMVRSRSVLPVVFVPLV